MKKLASIIFIVDAPSALNKLCLSFSVFLSSPVAYADGGEGGAKLYAHKKAWASINHSILSE
jgi:hypothetical protein